MPRRFRRSRRPPRLLSFTPPECYDCAVEKPLQRPNGAALRLLLMGVRENLLAVRNQIEAACQRVERDPAGVMLVGIGKTFPANLVMEAALAGLTDIGENRVQEAVPKIAEVSQSGIALRWHLVGHLQTNKVKQAIESFNLIHSVDSLHLAEAINKHATRPVSVLLEVNIGEEESKFGVAPDEVISLAKNVMSLPNIDLQGLMTVAPISTSAEDVRSVFRRLRELRDELGLPHLSMGMSGDFQVAIEEGSTMVRIGRAIFGERSSDLDAARTIQASASEAA